MVLGFKYILVSAARKQACVKLLIARDLGLWELPPHELYCLGRLLDGQQAKQNNADSVLT